MSKRVLAFDFGASSGRAMLGEFDGTAIRMTELHRFSNDPVTVGERMHWDILRLWYEIKQSLIKARLAGGIDAIGIDTWGVDFALLDRYGELLGAPCHYRDSRTEGMCEEVAERISPDKLYNRTGTQTMRINSLYQLYYMATRRPELTALARHLLFTPDLFAFWLTGAMRSEATIASTSNFYDPHKQEFASDLLEKLDIPTGLLCPLIRPGETYGTLRRELCEELDLPPVPVIAVCTHDTASAVAAVPTQERDFAYISCGTWSLFGTETAHPIINEKSRAVQFTNEGGFGGSIRFLKNIMGLWLIQESRRQWIREGAEVSYADLEREAVAAAPFRSFIDCDSPLFESAGDMPGRVRQFCRETGQPVPDTRGEVMRCIYQSLAMKYKYNLAQLTAITGTSYPALHIVGGGIKDTLLCRMTSDALGIPVIAGPAEATVMGNIGVQLLALGEIRDLPHLRQVIRASDTPHEYLPVETESFDAHYDAFLHVLGHKSHQTPT